MESHKITILYTDEDGWLGISYDPTLQYFILHMEIATWSKSKAKKAKEILEVCKNRLRELGIDKVYSLVKDKKRRKFNLFFGFKDTDLVVMDSNGVIFQVLELIC